MTRSSSWPAQQLVHLTNWVGLPAVLVSGPKAMQNSPFSSLMVAVNIATTHCTYPWRYGQAELTQVAGYITRWSTCLKTVAHPTTNRAQRWATFCSRPARYHYAKPPPVASGLLKFCFGDRQIEGLRERTEHLDIFLFSAHHSVVFYFWCSVYRWKGSIRF